jgi:transcription-repair coupling factor (superfamily II helicase)
MLSDREEAAYFQNDLQNLLGKTEVLFYPTSYKRPYHYEEVDNANVLMRGEILNKLSAGEYADPDRDLSRKHCSKK